MSGLRYVEARADDLDRVAALLRTCFPRATKFTPDYLGWCYYGNPAGPAIGYNIEDGGRLVGHLVGAPQKVRLKGADATVVLLMNVGTHPDYRGRGLFLELVERVVQLAARQGHAAVTGVANQQTYRAYEARLSFQNVARLDAHIELAAERIDMAGALARAQWSRRWDDATLAWRLKNPQNPLTVAAARPDSLIVEGASTAPGVRARGQVPREGLSASASGSGGFGPAVVLGLTPKGAAQRRFAVTLPERLRPSPLVMIYRNVKTPGDRLDPDRVLFSFLDFDAF
jgi:GNAT superfamily N-acetyltransferase